MSSSKNTASISPNGVRIFPNGVRIFSNGVRILSSTNCAYISGDYLEVISFSAEYAELQGFSGFSILYIITAKHNDTVLRGFRCTRNFEALYRSLSIITS